VRIISGTHKGRHFSPPRGFRSRPTTDIAREGLFNILSNRYELDGLKIIDLFAGSGSLSYEFASRGAVEVVSVEKSFPVFKHIIKNVKEFGLTSIRVVKKDAFKWIANYEEQADIIFADPPFDNEQTVELPKLILENNKLLPGGCLIIEHGKDIQFDTTEECAFTRTYGSVNFSFFFVD
jgi:16S rRNA (guanine(966)-N(2))-methyltransferase RsmD